MGLAETRAQRTVIDGICPVEITLAEAVYAGDCLGNSSGTWVLSAADSGELPYLVAGIAGVSGDRITAYPIAIVSFAVGTVTVIGEKIALNNSGEYVAAAGGFPDVGFTISATQAIICPSISEQDQVRA